MTAPTAFEKPQISRRIAIVAHDNKKVELLRWAEFNAGQLRHHQLSATGTTGTMLQYELGLKVHCFRPARWAVTSRSAPRSPRARSTS